MPRTSNKNKAHKNKQLWDRANNLYRVKWQTTSQQGYDFYLNQQLTSEEEKKKSSKFTDLLMTVFSICLALGLFFAAPIGLTTWLFDRDQEAFIG